MGYVQEGVTPKMKKSFIEVAAAEILDPARTTEPKEFKKNYPHYNFSDDTSLVGSTRYDSSFKNHGADELVESDHGLARVCLPCRPKTIIAVPKQKVPENLCECNVVIPTPVVLKPRPYTPVTKVTKVPYCKPIETIVDNIPMVKEANAEVLKEIADNGCQECHATKQEMDEAIRNGFDPYDGVVIGTVTEEP